MIASVELARGGLDTILRIGAYMRDIDDFEECDAVYRRVIARTPMVRTTVQIGGFAAPSMVEVDCLAYRRTERE